MTKSKPLKDGNGILVMEKQTPVINAIFGFHHLQKIKKEENQFYISERSRIHPPNWSMIKDRMSRVIHTFNLEQPDKYYIEAADYFESLIPQMLNNHRFTDDQATYLYDAICAIKNPNLVELELLFKIALIFDDGHGLKSLHFERSWHHRDPLLFHFSGDGIFASQYAVISTDTRSTMHFAQKLCTELQNNNLTEASRHVCEHVATLLIDIYDCEKRAKLIEQIAQDLPQIASVMFETIMNKRTGETSEVEKPIDKKTSVDVVIKRQ